MTQLESHLRTKVLFDLINKLGDGIHGNLHVILKEPSTYKPEDCIEYRCYHSDGYCFDVKKIRDFLGNPSAIKGHIYRYFGEWDGFKRTDLLGYIILIRNLKK